MGRMEGGDQGEQGEERRRGRGEEGLGCFFLFEIFVYNICFIGS